MHQCPAIWSCWEDLNLRSRDLQSPALPSWATARWYGTPGRIRTDVMGFKAPNAWPLHYGSICMELVGLEPTTLGMQHQVSSDWYYSPIFYFINFYWRRTMGGIEPPPEDSQTSMLTITLHSPLLRSMFPISRENRATRKNQDVCENGRWEFKKTSKKQEYQ